MDLPTQAHLKTLRDLLAYRLVELRADVHAAEQERQRAGDDIDVVGEVGDRKDEAMRDQLSALSGQQDERDREEMHRVEAAMRRLDAGTYGDCETCAEPIPLKRLLVQPAAARCADCQSRLESGLARAA
jgi:DnaK suppressor protein